MTLNDEIISLRDMLHESIGNNDDYDIIYNLSTELDKLIAMYYCKNHSYKVKIKAS
ncbi:hypothetical protein Curi_c12930 [Gottschalkia acidurici 9a]|uniref:Spo0E like sporulation regulatory protein n=1 Tax=Gottschalkia acidurici (strain ATCC 7906 / DSM 604 / BCRC 14475 / CIP 104303 / KCTC 5404 / NCIMB 10678 / 9a) TaxID=1128398 RepID=K0AYG6_GOTA9|nr:aspartyl-phosphate phosphatase Spo0E family protein [Gottschalkia acidurici]AFS78304.1 hypothetical protein Curi_c12930 [Gottschalkia acidurici 9a]